MIEQNVLEHHAYQLIALATELATQANSRFDDCYQAVHQQFIYLSTELRNDKDALNLLELAVKLAAASLLHHKLGICTQETSVNEVLKTCAQTVYTHFKTLRTELKQRNDSAPVEIETLDILKDYLAQQEPPPSTS